MKTVKPLTNKQKKAFKAYDDARHIADQRLIRIQELEELLGYYHKELEGTLSKVADFTEYVKLHRKIFGLDELHEQIIELGARGPDIVDEFYRE